MLKKIILYEKEYQKRRETKASLDETDLVGNIQSINISSQTNESLLVTIGSKNKTKVRVNIIASHQPNCLLPDEGVDLSSFNIIETLDGILDLVLVGLDVNEEGQSVVFFDLLHGSLGVERLTDNTVLIHTGSMGNRLTSILGGTLQDQGLGDVEVGGGTDLANSLTVNTFESGFLGGLSLGGSYKNSVNTFSSWDGRQS